MEIVVEVEVGDSVARLGPLEDVLPAANDDIHAAESPDRYEHCATSKSNVQGNSPGPILRADLAERAVNEVDRILPSDWAAALLPRAVANNTGVHLRARCQIFER